MNEPGSVLQRECRTFAGYLDGIEPDEYIVNKYVLGHRHIPYRSSPSPDRFDRFLVGVARVGPAAVRIADAYARLTRPTGPLRQKLVLLLAILENAPTTHAQFNSADESGPPRALFRVFIAGLISLFALGTALLLLGPVHLGLRLAGVAGPRS